MTFCRFHLKTSLYGGLALALFLGLTSLQAQSTLPQVDESKEALIKKIQTHYYYGRYRTALQLLEQLRQKDPEIPLLYSLSGDIYLILGELDRAEENIRIAIELSNRQDREYFRLGQVLYMKKKGPEAMEAFEKALKVNPQLNIVLFYQGLVQLFLFRNKEKTIEFWTAFRKASPDDPQGPEIDRALAILARPDYTIPVEPPQASAQGCQFLPPCQNGPGQGQNQDQDTLNRLRPENSRVPYMNPEAEKEKENKENESIIKLDDL